MVCLKTIAYFAWSVFQVKADLFAKTHLGKNESLDRSHNHTPHAHSVHIPNRVINCNCTQAPLDESHYNMGCNYINYMGCNLQRSYQKDSGEVISPHILPKLYAREKLMNLVLK